MLPVVIGLCFGLASLILLVRDALLLKKIPQIEPRPALEPLTSIDVLVPARNEAHNIGHLLRGMAQQTSSDWQLTILDDHSTDQTSAIVAEVAAHDQRVRLLHGQTLPAGWTGKCWACWQLAEASSSEWLLFLDADTKPQPAMLAQALAYAEAEKLDLLTFLPFSELGSFWEKTLLPAFFSIIQAAYPVSKVNTPGSGVVLANGQFILVRRSAYLRAGGHAAVRDRVLEDVELAQAIVRAGGVMKAVYAGELLRVRMYTNGSEVREGLVKNAIAGLRNGGARSSWAGFRQILVGVVPFGLALLSMWAWLRRWTFWPKLLLSGMATLLNGFAFWSWGRFMQQLYGLSRRHALLFPLGIVCYMLLAAEAAWRIWSGRGVTWKGRTYKE
ncbi:glycosyltransferase [Herpetosiphon geysericola]|uniref:Glycosyltransferase 2-like domain-containing protein n=1 Tax=Herpetosiphon geysericola TaxID=70996 RepID=A0A0P6YDP1_9CHLR|nr:glycosyltransferase [Herpetosiphon geysericola]KPL80131.1 hypothetical protein SE18_23930 [Herpetosiphon geysericola]